MSIFNYFKRNVFLQFLVFIHLIFIIYQTVNDNYLTMLDSLEYLELSKNIGHYFEFYCGDLSKNIDYGYYTRRPPLYSIFLLVTSLFFTSKATIIIVQSLLSISSILVTKKIFEDQFEQINKIILYLFMIFSLSQFIYANMLMSEIFVQFLIVLTIYVANLILKYKSTKHLLIYQSLITLLLLTKPVFYLLVIPNIIITFIFCKRVFLKPTLTSLTSIIPIVIVLLYCHWNFERTGSYDFSSIQHVNLKDYNLKYFHLNKYGEEYANKVNHDITVKSREISEYPKKIEFIKTQSIDHLSKELIPYLFFHLRGSIKFFIDPGRYDLFMFFYPNSNKISEVGFLSHFNKGGFLGVFKFLKTQPTPLIISLVIILILNIVKFLGFIWFWLKNAKNINLIFYVMLFFILFLAGISGPVSAARFTIPIYPLYFFFAIYGINSFIKISNLTGSKHL
ncbi:hypothetical protein [Aquimarina sp. 433]